MHRLLYAALGLGLGLPLLAPAGSASADAAPFASIEVPTHVEVGVNTVSLPVTINLNDGADTVRIGLYKDLSSGAVETFAGEVLTSSDGHHFSGRVTFKAHGGMTYGSSEWVVTVQGGAANNTQTSVKTDVREHSLLGDKVSRSGSDVTVAASARSLNSAASQWVAYSNDLLTIQRWSTSGWVTLSAVHANAQGNVRATFHIPWKVGIRVTDSSTAKIWGQTTVSSAI